MRAYQLGVDAIDELERLAAAIPEGSDSPAETVSISPAEGIMRAVSSANINYGARTDSGPNGGMPGGSSGRMGSGHGERSGLRTPRRPNALRLTRHVLTRACRRGLRLYSRTNVIACETAGRRASITCGRGYRVHARYLIFATGYELPPMLSEPLSACTARTRS